MHLAGRDATADNLTRRRLLHHRRVLDALGIGLVLGLGSGLAPGPLFGLVVLASLRGGVAAGTRVALVPLITDTPIVVLSLTVVSSLPSSAVTVLSVVGGVVVIVFGVQALWAARHPAVAEPDVVRRSVWQAILVNLVSPHPWLFWISVGAPLTVATWHDAHAGAVLFVVAFYAMLVGSKLALAWLVAAGRRRVTARANRALGIAAGLLMIATGVLLVSL